MTARLDLPDYREMDLEVAERFDRIRQRPVVLEVDQLGKVFGDGPDAAFQAKRHWAFAPIEASAANGRRQIVDQNSG